jgi:hypothetical protein
LTSADTREKGRGKQDREADEDGARPSRSSDQAGGRWDDELAQAVSGQSSRYRQSSFFWDGELRNESHCQGLPNSK